MKGLAPSILISIILLTVTLFQAVGTASAQDAPIVIRADGTVEGTSLIARSGNLYTFTADIHNGAITILKDNVVLDGKGFSLSGSDAITLTDLNNVTIRNLSVISPEGTGIMINQASGCSFFNLSIKAERAGLRARNMSSSAIVNSSVEARVEYAIAFASSPSNQIANNTIVSSMIDAVDCALSSGNQILGNNITYKPSQFALGSGIQSDGSRNLTIKENTITGFPMSGINLQSDSDNNNLEANVVMYCNSGIRVASDGNTLTGNYVASNLGVGISLDTAARNTLRGNRIANNTQNLQVGSYSAVGWINDVDVSNWAEDKVVYYWVNEAGKTVPSNAGYVALVNCTGVTVEKQAFSGAGDCIVLAYTANSTVQKNSLSDNSSVRLYSSSGNAVRANTFTNNDRALVVESSSFNKISGNNYTNNNYAISLISSSSNTVAQNSFANNINGLYFSSASNNNIYLNNFQSNLHQVSDSGLNNPYASVAPVKASSTSGLSLRLMSVRLKPLNFIGPLPLSANNWDDGAKGNYWNGYNGTDKNGDGIGDTPLYLYGNNQDNYPLMALVNIENPAVESTASPSLSLSPSPPLNTPLSPSPTISIVPSASPTRPPTQESSPTPVVEYPMNPTTLALTETALLVIIVTVALGLFVYFKKSK